MESGKLLLQRYLAAHGRLGADVHFDDALMEAGDLRFARGKDLVFQRNLAGERSAQRSTLAAWAKAADNRIVSSACSVIW